MSELSEILDHFPGDSASMHVVLTLFEDGSKSLKAISTRTGLKAVNVEPVLKGLVKNGYAKLGEDGLYHLVGTMVGVAKQLRRREQNRNAQRRHRMSRASPRTSRKGSG